jgi:hypothetical protein
MSGSSITWLLPLWFSTPALLLHWLDAPSYQVILKSNVFQIFADVGPRHKRGHFAQTLSPFSKDLRARRARYAARRFCSGCPLLDYHADLTRIEIDGFSVQQLTKERCQSLSRIQP